MKATKSAITEITNEISAMREAGVYKQMQTIGGAMGATVDLRDGGEVVNLCSNNYLGLADHPDVISGAKVAMDKHGYGTSSVRFICGTFSLHEELEAAIAEFTGKERATTYASCWNANQALVTTLLADGGVVISDELNHASIIDACRLCGKNVKRMVYKHSDMDDLAAKLAEADGATRKLIITDGVFSMEGDLGKLDEIVKLGEKFDALVAVDDSHGHGVVGRSGRGTAEHFDVSDKVDIVTGTLGKALGGAAGGFIAGSEAVIELMVQRSRPQLFSNSIAPAVAGGSLAAIKLLIDKPQRVGYLHENVDYLRSGLTQMGYDVVDSPTAILPIIVGETATAIRLAKLMLEHGVLITGFGYPVVPEGTARLRAQVSASHTRGHLDTALKAFESLKALTA